jgi:hypothetical protein
MERNGQLTGLVNETDGVIGGGRKRHSVVAIDCGTARGLHIIFFKGGFFFTTTAEWRWDGMGFYWNFNGLWTDGQLDRWADGRIDG